MIWRDYAGLDQQWDVNSNGQAVNCQDVKLREFRYDSGRRRYLYRERHPETLAPTATEWTDYDGDAPWLDYTLSGASATAVNEYVAGLAQRIVGESDTVYFHGDQIGSTRMVSDAAGLPARRVVYTAFGEPVFSEPPAHAGGLTRYLYAGAFGYETGLLSNDPASNARYNQISLMVAGRKKAAYSRDLMTGSEPPTLGRGVRRCTRIANRVR